MRSPGDYRKLFSHGPHSSKNNFFEIKISQRPDWESPSLSYYGSWLLTKKLPTFLSRLNEISGGCEKIAPVSGSFCSILKLLRMMAFTGLL